jgi:regulatory protein
VKSKKLTYTVEEAQKKLERYCAYQDRCHREVEKKLDEMHMIPEAKELILINLIQNDFLNEERFSKSFARGKFRIKKWGKQRIIRELKRREISDYNIREALKEISDEDYFSTLEEVAEKKYKSITEKDLFKKRKKVCDFLLRKGYEYSLINEILSDLS